MAPERVVQTLEFESAPGHVSLETATFEEVDGKTQMTVQSVFQTVEDHDVMVESGMEVGARETWDRFAELVEGRETVSEEESRWRATPPTTKTGTSSPFTG